MSIPETPGHASGAVPPVRHRRRARHPARRTRRGVAVAAVSATVLLAGGLWGVDQLTAANPTAATSSVDTSGSSAQRNTTTYDDGSSEYDDSSSSSGGTSFTPSVSHADTSSHAS